MEERNFMPDAEQDQQRREKRKKFLKTFRVVTLILLAFVWVGYFYTGFVTDGAHYSRYTFFILILSIMNADVLLKVKRIEPAALNILTKAEGILFFLWVMYNVVALF